MAIVPVDGSSIGNMTIRTHLGWSAEHYAKVRQPLIDAGLLTTGRGRGGSVRRTAASIVKRPS